MSELRARPQYVANSKDADLIFVEYDTMRQCIYPHLTSWHECMDAQNVAFNARPAEIHNDNIDDFVMNLHMKKMTKDYWTVGTEELKPFINAVDAIHDQITNRQAIVYFANVNSWNQGPKHHDIENIKQMQARLGVKVLFVGMDLVKSSTDHASAVNILMPLLPTGQFYEMSHAARDESETLCKQRSILASFVGKLSTPMRNSIFALHDESIGIICKENKEMAQHNGMKEMLLNSTFGFAPRGDAHYSFRLTEILAAGAVPVIIDDEATPPYGADSFQTWAVVIRENEIANAPKILQALDKDAICRMKEEGRNLLTYARDMKGTVDGMLVGLHHKLLA